LVKITLFITKSPTKNPDQIPNKNAISNPDQLTKQILIHLNPTNHPLMMDMSPYFSPSRFRFMAFIRFCRRSALTFSRILEKIRNVGNVVVAEVGPRY
jgi:hypothetical protein